MKKTAEEMAAELLGAIWVNYMELHGLKVIFEKDWQDLQEKAANKS